jgi:hypothetical protein
MVFIPSKDISLRGRPSRYGRSPRTLSELYPMDQEEIIHRIGYTKATKIFIGWFSPTVKDLMACDAKRPALKEFAVGVLNSGFEVSCLEYSDSFVVVMLNDVRYFTSGVQTTPIIPATQDTHTHDTVDSTATTSTSQLTTLSALQEDEKSNAKVSIKPLYDPRLDPQSDEWDTLQYMHRYDYDLDYGDFPCWRNTQTGEVSKIPSDSKYAHLNEVLLESISRSSMDKLLISTSNDPIDPNDPNDIVPDEDDPHSEDAAIAEYLASKKKS